MFNTKDSAAIRVEEYSFIDFPSIFPKDTIEAIEKKDILLDQKLQKQDKTHKIKDKKNEQPKDKVNMTLDMMFLNK